jgi:hypothetical protein
VADSSGYENQRPLSPGGRVDPEKRAWMSGAGATSTRHGGEEGFAISPGALEVVVDLNLRSLVPFTPPGTSRDVAAVDVDGLGERLTRVLDGLDGVVTEKHDVARLKLSPSRREDAP